VNKTSVFVHLQHCCGILAQRRHCSFVVHIGCGTLYADVILHSYLYVCVQFSGFSVCSLGLPSHCSAL